MSTFRHRRVRWKHYGIEVNSTVDVFDGKRVIEVYTDTSAGLTPAQADLTAAAIRRAARYVEQENFADKMAARDKRKRRPAPAPAEGSPPASHDFVAGNWPNEHVCRVCGLIPHANHPDQKYRARPTSPPAEPSR